MASAPPCTDDNEPLEVFSPDDKALHINPRFEPGSSWIFGNRGDEQIVLNALINNKWGVEERYANVFKEGSPFTIRILVLTEYFKVLIITPSRYI
ncbi:unnamed protein product [Enterobius vermicularis]|uniref:Galectin n=1 Tax=Enterobius vermicularis TaxID=51028 RepID=A0A0N4V6T6_ENTVE|nr:unnamed protein product [Enterobius vermicularis]